MIYAIVFMVCFLPNPLVQLYLYESIESEEKKDS